MSILEKEFTPSQMRTVYLVDLEQDGMRLDQFIQLYLTCFSRQTIKKKIAEKEIYIRNRDSAVRPSTKVRENDNIVLLINKTSHEDEYWKGEKLNLITTPEIVFEDEQLIVISKPPFMAAHPTGRHIFNCASVYFESVYKKTIRCIHRLDRETSGILLLGKDREVTTDISNHFEHNNVRKCYFFIAKTNQDDSLEDQFIAEERLGQPEGKLKRVLIIPFPKDSKEGRSAQTTFKILRRHEEYAIGLAFPRTGRQHQIRVHAKEHGHPLLGDTLYLGDYPLFQRYKDGFATDRDHDLLEINRHALHSIGIEVPYKGKKERFITPIPTDFTDWMKIKIPEAITKDLDKLISKEINDYFDQE